MPKISSWARRRAANLLRRITSISTPLGGVQWSPGPDEREAIRQLFVYLEDRRVLFVEGTADLYEVARHHLEMKGEVSDSCLAIRKALTETMQKAPFNAAVQGQLEVMREACRNFLDIGPIYSPENRTPFFESRLGELRLNFGLCLSNLSSSYELELGSHMKHLAAEARRYVKIASTS